MRAGLREHGYVEGRNLVLDIRAAEGRPERLPRLAEELVSANVDVILAGVTQTTQAARQATTTVPIVMVGVVNPVASGFVATLARPGGNITGLAAGYGDVFSAKWLELLKEAVPKASVVGVVYNSTSAGTLSMVKEVERTASRNPRGAADQVRSRHQYESREVARASDPAVAAAACRPGHRVMSGGGAVPSAPPPLVARYRFLPDVAGLAAGPRSSRSIFVW